MRLACVAGVLASLCAAGCVDKGPGDPSEALFLPDHMLEIAISMAAADWEQLRHEPDRIDAPRVTCVNQPTDPKYTYFPAEVTVDGTTYTDIAVRKKGGFGSLSTLRPALKVKTNEYVPGQRILGVNRLTLNNNHQDPALVRQCLTYALFSAAGVPASRCSFAHVTVNGEDLGVYSHVESIQDDFFARHFADDSGNYYEGGADFRPGWVDGFQPKVNEEAPDCSDLQPLVAALQVPDGELEGAVDRVFDLDEFLSFWAMEVITDHWDGYTNGPNNFFIYHDPSSDKFSFVPWGVDSTFEGRQRTTRPSSVFACGILPWRLYDVATTRDRYIDRLNDLLTNVWNPDALLAEIDRMQTLITPYENNDVADLAGEIQHVRDFVSTRRGVLEAELAGGPPVWPTPLLDPPCLVSLGSISGSFSASWGTLGNYPSGSGATTGSMAGTAIDSTTVNATAGLDQEGKPTFQILALLPDGRYAVAVFVIQNVADYAPGAFALDLAHTAGFAGFYDPQTDTFTGSWLLLGGQITFTDASQTPGGPVTATFSTEAFEL